MAIQAPPPNWFKSPLGKDEKLWTYMIIVMVLMMGIFTTVWLFFGAQNVPEQYYTFEKASDFRATAVSENTVANGVFYDTLDSPELTDEPAFSRTTSGDVYMVAERYKWGITNGTVTTSALKLKVNQVYKLHVGSVDYLHGFEIMGGSFVIAIQIVPNYDYVIDFQPTTTGLFRIICNEYCGAGHHTMTSFLEVVS